MKFESRAKRKLRIKSKIRGSADRPRLVIFKSNRHLFAQIIDDDNAKTIVSVRDVKAEKKSDMSRQDIYYNSGSEIAQKAVKKGITKVVFDRGGYRYHGLVSKFAEGARKGGLIF